MNNIQLATCDRCGVPCKVADTSNPEARLLQHSTVPSGYCPDCGTTAFLKTSPMGRLISDPAMLLAPHVQAKFALMMQSGNADASPDEINWQRVVENWDLPLPQQRKRRKS